MNTKEAAAFLRKTERQVTWLCARQKIVGAFKDGGSWYMTKDALIIYKITHSRNSKNTIRVEQVGDTINGEEYISVKEAAEILGQSLRAVQRYCSNSRLVGARRDGDDWLIPRSSVYALLRTSRGKINDC